MPKQNTFKPIRALYIRVSTEAQAEEGYSIPAQSERLEAYCKAMDWGDYQLYIDGGFSGSNLNRPQMQRLIADAKAGKLQSVIVYKLDRLSRSQKDTLFLIEDVFLPNDVDFISLNESIDTSTPYGRAMIGILSAFAQLERENIYMRTRMGMLERVKQGYWPGGGNIPYGYDYDRNLGILIPNTDAKNVPQIYDLYIKGYSSQKIANMFGLTSDKVVTDIISRKSNLGLIPYNGECYPGKHKAIISEEVYELAQRKMRERSNRARATEKSAHLLSGLIYCGVCGARLRYIKWGKAGYKLRCYSHDTSKPYMQRDADCSYEPVWADQVEKVVLNDLFQLSANMKASFPSCESAVFDPLLYMSQRITQMENKLKRLYNLYAEGADDALLATIEENKKSLALLKADYAEEEKTKSTSRHIDRINALVSSISESWPHLTALERQTLIRDCVDKIVITNHQIEIFYTFKQTSEKDQVA